MRNSSLHAAILLPLFLFAALFPLAPQIVAGDDDVVILESIRQTLDGMETDQARIHWDDQGIRVEQKEWWEKGLDWVSSLFDGNRRKRSQTSQNGDGEELIRVDAKIVFYKNGTRIVDIQNGPLINVNPKGQIQVDYRNGTVHQMGGRKRRFATLDDLYGAHGFEMGQKDAADFGRGMNEEEKGDGSSGSGAVAAERADDGSDEEAGDGAWRWADAGTQQDAYWDRPLYGARQPAVAQQQIDQKQPAPSPSFLAPPAQPAAPSRVGGQSGQQVGQQQGSQQSFGGPQNNAAGTGAALPPSPSPSSWVYSRLNSREPLSPEELELAKELLRRMVEQQAGDGNGKGETAANREDQRGIAQGKMAGGGGSGGSANANGGGAGEVPQWAQPKTN